MLGIFALGAICFFGHAVLLTLMAVPALPETPRPLALAALLWDLFQ